MKIFKKITLILITILVFQSCNSADELTQVNFTTDLAKNISFTTNTSGDFNKTITINLAEYGDVSDYLNKIENIKINTADYKITAFTGTNLETGGSFTMVSENQEFGPFIHSSFLSDFQGGNSFAIEGADKLNVLATKLKNSNVLEIVLSGSSTTSEVYDMSIKINFNVTITAQAL